MERKEEIERLSDCENKVKNNKDGNNPESKKEGERECLGQNEKKPNVQRSSENDYEAVINKMDREADQNQFSADVGNTRPYIREEPVETKSEPSFSPKDEPEAQVVRRPPRRKDKERKEKTETPPTNSETEAKKRKEKEAEAAATTNDASNMPDSSETSKKCQATTNPSGIKLRRELGLLDCVGLIVGNMIGSGIFVSPRGVLKYSGSVGMSLIIWVASGFASMVSAFCYAELGTMIPQSGGSYTYLHEAFGPAVAFLDLWLGVTIGIPCSRAIGALTFANYLVQPFFPGCAEMPQPAVKLIAIALIFFLTWLNCRRVTWATTLQDALALTKVLALVIIIVGGMHHLAQGHTENFENAMEGTNWHPALIATTFYHTLWAYAGWGSLNSIMEELKDPFKNMPRAIAISLTCVTIIYVLTNIAYFAVLTPEEILSSEAVAVSFGRRILGILAWFIPIFVASSTSGSLNGNIFGSSRLLFVGARRGHLPRALGLVAVGSCTPVTSLVFMAAISLIMFTTSDLRVLINYTAFAGNLIGLGIISAFFWFRIKQPDRPRPIKVGSSRVYVNVGLLMSVFLVVFPAVRQPVRAFALGFAATGLLVYYVTQHKRFSSARLDRAMVSFICPAGGRFPLLLV
ncbi:Y+L amino acid transporter 2-like [Penaeus japonicus]|uniref:Y+L amino acid transporter 2-like n=1 Tax=Penaeus japonicus TaxID=27405 RepID=UPI001C70D09D|nr:Y+L amino acid transporter 2-like [Penaeus japonicus]